MSYICNHTGLGRIEQHPFGMVMQERSNSYEDYRFGFNGMEQEDELFGKGNSLDFGARIYNPRLARWCSVDPLWSKYPQFSDYVISANTPLGIADVDGRDFEMKIYKQGEKKKVQISAEIYTISKQHQNEICGAAMEWNKLSGSTVVIDGEEFEVDVNIQVYNAKSHRRTRKQLSKRPFANAYFGEFKVEANEWNVLQTAHDMGSDRNLNLDLGYTIDNKSITIPTWDIILTDAGQNARVARKEADKSLHNLTHEVGHLLGLDDFGGKYYSKGGVTDYSTENPPNLDNLKHVIQYGVANGKSSTGNVNLSVSPEAVTRNDGSYIDLQK